MRILAFDLFPQPEWASGNGVEYVDIEVLARESDVLSLHLPLTPKTKFIIHRGTLELMKPGAILINVSGGSWSTPPR